MDDNSNRVNHKDNEALLKLKNAELQYYKVAFDKFKAKQSELNFKKAYLEKEKIYLVNDNIELQKQNASLIKKIEELEEEKGQIKKDYEAVIVDLWTRFEKRHEHSVARQED